MKDEANLDDMVCGTAARGMSAPRELPPELRPVPEFDLKVLPEPFGDYVDERASLLDCPPEFVAVPLMTSLGAVLGNKVAIRPKQHDPWTVYPNLWGAIVGLPAAMKSPASRAGLSFIHTLQKEAEEVEVEDCKEWSKNRWVFEEKQKLAKKEAGIAIKKGEEPDLTFLDEAGEGKPESRQCICNNSTLEALHELLSRPENRNGVLCEQDELAALLGKMKDPTKGEELRSFYLKGWNGDQRETYNRIGRGRVIVEKVCLSVFGGIQPGKLAPIVTDAVNQTDRDDGFIQRFGLLVWPDLREHWTCNDHPVDSETFRVVMELFKRADELKEDNNPWRFTPEACKQFKQWLEVWRKAGIKEHPALQNHFLKYNSLVVQLAALIHFIEEEYPEKNEIQISSLLKAIDWIDYLSEHARRVYGGSDQNQVIAAKKIVEKLKVGKLEFDPEEGFTARDIYIKNWSGIGRNQKATVQSALELLDDYDWLSSVEVKNPSGGPAKKVYFPHPSITPKVL